MLIRPRGDADLAACVALVRWTHELDGYPTYPQPDPARFLAPAQETAAWVAELAGRLVGHAALHDAATVLDVHQSSAAPIRLYERAGWQRLEALALPIAGRAPLPLWVYLGPAPPAQPA